MRTREEMVNVGQDNVRIQPGHHAARGRRISGFTDHPNLPGEAAEHRFEAGAHHFVVIDQHHAQRPAFHVLSVIRPVGVARMAR